VAHSLSAKKRVRQNERRRLHNRSRRSALRTRIRACRDAILRMDLKQAESAFVEACRLLDRESDRGLIHPNAAARKKSRLARRLNTLRARANASSDASNSNGQSAL